MPAVLNARIVGTKGNTKRTYVGRPSKWGNPFQIGKHGNREEVIFKYMDWFITQNHLIDQIIELKGLDLVCWCAPHACHADFLVELANSDE